jgi:hypothetical protein
MGGAVTGLSVEHREEEAGEQQRPASLSWREQRHCYKDGHVRVAWSDFHRAGLSAGTRRGRSSGLVHPAG